MKKKKDILLLTEYFFPEEFIINDLALEWKKIGYSVDVLTHVPSYPFGKVYKGFKNKLIQKDVWNDMTIYRLFTKQNYHQSVFSKILNYLFFVILGSITALFLARRYNKIFIYHIGPLTSAIPAVLVKKIFHIDVTIWTQDLWPDTVYSYGFKKKWYSTLFLNWLVKWVYKNCCHILVSCEGFISKIKKYVPQKEVLYFPNWPLVNYDKKNMKKISLSKKFNFTFAGNIGKVQNLENVIRGFSLLSRDNKNVQLNIIGDGSHLSTLKHMVKKENMKNIVFWGRKKLDDMPIYFNASDVLLISLKNDPLFELTVPSKFQAYLCANRPILCIMKGEVAFMVKKYRIGICAEPDNLMSIKQGFLKLFKMKKNKQVLLKKNAEQLLKTTFNRQMIINSLTALMFKGLTPKKNDKKRETVLISGVNGYIGSRLANDLINKGYTVLGVDLDSSHIKPLLSNPDFLYIQTDITKKKSLKNRIPSADILIHCAALVHSPGKRYTRKDYYNVNVKGTSDLFLELKSKVKQTIFLSSVSTYGSGYTDIVPDENTKPMPEDNYGWSKVQAEKEIISISKKNTIKYTILRLAPVYGDGFLVNINKRIFLPKKIGFYRITEGEQRISLCSVNNVVDIISKALMNRKFYNNIFNIKDKKNYSINQIIKIFKEIFLLKYKKVFQIPSIIPDCMLNIIGMISPDKKKFYAYQLQKIISDSIYSNKKLINLKINLTWDLKNTLKQKKG